MVLRALRMMLWQCLVILGLAAITWPVQGIQAAFSVFLGGLCYWLPTFIFAMSIFRFTAVRQAKEFIIAFFIGEVVKLMLSGSLFLFCIKYLPVSALPLIVGYIGAILAFWIVLAFSLM
jgi:ATP synthase protein I